MPLDDFDPADLDAPSDPAHPEPPRSRRLRLRRWLLVEPVNAVHGFIVHATDVDVDDLSADVVAATLRARAKQRGIIAGAPHADFTIASPEAFVAHFTRAAVDRDWWRTMGTLRTGTVELTDLERA